MENKKVSNINLTHLLIFGGIVLGLFLILRKSSRTNNFRFISEPSPIKFISGSESEKEQMMSNGGKRYLNAETWDISWNDEGLPERITVHRDAVQS